MDKFYESIINDKKEVGKIFESFDSNQTVQKWQEVQSQFHDAIELNYPAIRCDIGNGISKEQNPIPQRLSKRIKVTTLILGLLVLGGKYNRNMYLNAVKFCTMTDINKEKITPNFCS